jgi:hypothetical protein
VSNPYSPSNAEFGPQSNKNPNRLFYILAWFPVAIVGSMVATPADRNSSNLAMAFALPCFLFGAAWASGSSIKCKCGFAIFFSIAASAIATCIWLPPDALFTPIAILFTLANIVIGYQSARSICRKRRRVFAALGLSYLIGVPLGPLGVVVLSIPSVLLANSSVDSVDDNRG